MPNSKAVDAVVSIPAAELAEIAREASPATTVETNMTVVEDRTENPAVREVKPVESEDIDLGNGTILTSHK